jgi:hypothetical protein
VRLVRAHAALRLGTVGRGAGRGGAVGVGVDLDDRRPDLDGRALGDEQPRDDARPRARQVDQRLRGLDLDDRLVDLDVVADGDVPGDDLGLGEALAGVGQGELLVRGHAGAPGGQKARVRSTASSSRSRLGR